MVKATTLVGVAKDRVLIKHLVGLGVQLAFDNISGGRRIFRKSVGMEELGLRREERN